MKKAGALNQMYLWDVTIPEEKITLERLKTFCKQYCKKWVFQKERGEKGYLHWQVRISLKAKRRMDTLKNLLGIKEAHLSVTHDKTFEYCQKEETRVLGPFSDQLEPLKPTRDIVGITKLYPWQQEVLESCEKYDDRSVNWLFCGDGNIGKSALVKYLLTNRKAEYISFCNNFKEMNRQVFCLPTAKAYCIDLPRALDKKGLNQMVAGIEQLKNGIVFDDRYSFKRKIFDPPVVWVFSNSIPNTAMLSKDRWKCWEVNPSKHLKRVYDNWSSVIALQLEQKRIKLSKRRKEDVITGDADVESTNKRRRLQVIEEDLDDMVEVGRDEIYGDGKSFDEEEYYDEAPDRESENEFQDDYSDYEGEVLDDRDTALMDEAASAFIDAAAEEA